MGRYKNKITPYSTEDNFEIKLKDNIDSKRNGSTVQETVIDLSHIPPLETLHNGVSTANEDTSDSANPEDRAQEQAQWFSSKPCCSQEKDSMPAVYESNLPNDEENDRRLMEFVKSELDFQIPQNQVDDIKESVGKTVKLMVDKVCQSDSLLSKRRKLDSQGVFQTRIVNVGSMKEGTRNYFPDEFDFLIFIADCDEPTRRRTIITDILETFHEELEGVIREGSNTFVHNRVTFSKLVRKSGPASKVLFWYKPSSCFPTWRKIHVDLVPAVQIPVRENDVKIGDYIRLDTLDLHWRQKIIKTGSYAMIYVFYREGGGRLKASVTETEMDFMQTDVSRRHKLAYRCMKHFINGHDGNETIKHTCKTTGEVECCPCCIPWKIFKYDLPSYALKTLLFKHVEKCQSDVWVSRCIREMMYDLTNCFKISDGYITTVLNRCMEICSRKKCEKISARILQISSSFLDLRFGKVSNVPTLSSFVMCLALKANCKLFLLVCITAVVVCAFVISKSGDQ